MTPGRRFRGTSVERSGVGTSQRRKEQDMRREKQDPAVLLEPRDPAMPETRPARTSASSILAPYCCITNPVKRSGLNKNSGSSWFCGLRGSAGWCSLGVLHVVFRCHPSLMYKITSSVMCLLARMVQLDRLGAGQAPVSVQPPHTVSLEPLVAWRSHPTASAFPRASAPREEESCKPAPRARQCHFCHLRWLRGIWRSTPIQGQEPTWA